MPRSASTTAGFVLDDMKSRNGTFVHILGSRPLRSGDVILAGRVLFRVVDSSIGALLTAGRGAERWPPGPFHHELMRIPA